MLCLNRAEVRTHFLFPRYCHSRLSQIFDPKKAYSLSGISLYNCENSRQARLAGLNFCTLNTFLTRMSWQSGRIVYLLAVYSLTSMPKQQEQHAGEGGCPTAGHNCRGGEENQGRFAVLPRQAVHGGVGGGSGGSRHQRPHGEGQRGAVRGETPAGPAIKY